jgi:multiple sugar transport system permease protein
MKGPILQDASSVRKKARWNATRKEALLFYLLISPWLLGFVCFVLGPMIASFIISLTKWDLLTPARFIGFKNYAKALNHDPLFWTSLKVTFSFAIFAVPLSMIFSLGLALLLNQAVWGMRLFRTIFYLPAVVSGVSVMVLWIWIFNPEIGLLNTALGYFGIKGPGWIFDPDWALPSLVLMSLWGVGGGVIIWLAGLKGIPTSLYEAAELDGATTWHKFRNVTLPLLTPTIFFILIMDIVGALQKFGEAYVMTKGGPMNSTLFYNFYLFTNAFENFNMGYASALAWFLFLIILTLTLFVVKSSAAWVHYEGERR